MSDSNPAPEPRVAQATPNLRDVDSPPREDVLDGVPSTDEIIERAQPAEKIVEQQPSVEELVPQRRR